MPTAKDTIMGLGIAAAVALGGANMLRGTSAPPELPPGTASSQSRPPTNRCKEACDSLPEGCLRAINCVDLLTARERDSSDGGEHFSCSEPLPQSLIDYYGWCPRSGFGTPIAMSRADAGPDRPLFPKAGGGAP